MAVATDFCLLGPLLVRSGDVVAAVRPGKQRAVLAALLLSGGKVVSLDELAEILWGQEPPPSARVTIQNYVMRLRQALADTSGPRISTQPHGYLIRMDPGELDVARFEFLLGVAGEAARNGSWDTAAAQSRAALALWRGEPLSDVDCEVLAAREVPRLAELRLQALEVRIEADLNLGRQAEVIAELRQLVTGHPLREHLHSLLMLALYRDDRQGEALAAYQDARRVLVEELGTEPGPGLRQLHRQILAGDPALAAPAPVPPAAGAAMPRELPAGVAHFTGRASELAALSALLNTRGDEIPGTVVIGAIGGTAGVGKTALALHWAHQAVGGFPDGQLYVDLRGYDPAQPVTPADALAGLLRSLGLAGHDIPAEEADRAVRYRTLLAGRRMLVMLDNAGSAEQVRPLLPGDPACAVVVTSRDALSGLVARDGARRLDLDVLPLRDAVSLLQTLIGARVDAEPDAAAELASQCCRLPLALRVAAELAATRPAASLASLAGELADVRTRLDRLAAGGDPRTEVRAVFSWSYRHLDAHDARTFRLLGLHPGPDFEPYAAAALTGTTVQQARRALDVLARAHLCHPTSPGRYGMHDLLWGYAGELTATLDTGQEQRAALTRLFDHYLYTAAAAADTLYPYERQRRPGFPVIPADRSSGPPVVDAVSARAWLDAQRPSLVAAVVHAATRGWPRLASGLASVLFRYFDVGAYHSEAITIHDHSRRAASEIGDHAAETTALIDLGLVNVWQERWQQAAGHLKRALALCQETGDRAGEARALHNLGIIEIRHCRYEQAARFCRHAVRLSRECGEQCGEIRGLLNLGFVETRQGYLEQAIQHFQKALELCRKTGDRNGEAHSLAFLGDIYRRQDSYQQALWHNEQALVLYEETGDRPGKAHALADLGYVYRLQGNHRQATECYQLALTLFQAIGDRTGEAETLNGLGEAYLAIGPTPHARSHYARALNLATQIGDKHQQARAHSGLARGCQTDGDSVKAQHHWQEALTRYTAIGAPEAREIRARLAIAVDGGDDGHKPTGAGSG